MYLTGAPHPHKADAQVVLEKIVASGERIVTDAEVLQEVLHRFSAIKRPDAIPHTIQLILEIADEVFAIEKSDVLRAAEIVQNPAGLSARDAIHVAIMERHGVRSIFSFDADFDRWPGLTRLHRI
jgi:predicted nucleic acid-binding protein